MRNRLILPLNTARGLASTVAAVGRAVEQSARRTLGLSPPKHITICGFPRSGTSMFSNMLGATLLGFRFDRRERRCTDALGERGNRVSKRPLDILETRTFATNNVHRKDIMVLILLRDPRDVITSVHENVPNEYFIGYEAGCRVWGTYPNYQYAMDHVGLGEIYRAVQATRESKAVSSVVLRYEDLVADPDAVQSRLAETFGLSFRGRSSEFHEHPDQHVFKPPNTRPLDPSLVKWDKQVSMQWVCRWTAPVHRRRILDQVSRYPGLLSMIRELGYETSDTWFDRFCREETAGGAEESRHAS
ncbi:MAG: sulfotransferase domain-containing protein [Planctomycetota bacterium]